MSKETPQYDSQTLEELFQEGLRLFNHEEYFECHEVLEALWNREQEPERQFTQGIIQIAVGLYHAGGGNLAGARKLLPRGLQRVRGFAPTHRNLNLLRFIASVDDCINRLGSSDSDHHNWPPPPQELPKL